jgi:hypothetical protein
MQFGDSSVPIGVVVHPGGKRAWVAHANADVILLDLEKWTAAGTLKAGREPDGMASTPRGDRRSGARALKKGDFGLTRREGVVPARAHTPWRIQRFLDGLDYDVRGGGCRLAAACCASAGCSAWTARCWAQPRCGCRIPPADRGPGGRVRRRPRAGRVPAGRPLGRGGALQLLRAALPRALYRTIRDLALSYFENYFNLRRREDAAALLAPGGPRGSTSANG